MTQINVKIQIPKGMSRKKFDQWLDALQAQVSAMSNVESTETEKLLEYAEANKLLHGGSFNFNVKQQLDCSNLPDNCKFVVNEFMRYGYLPTLHEIIQERKTRQIITDEVNEAENVFRSKGYAVDGDFWKKKVWLNSEQYRLTLVGRGMEIKNMMYVKAVALFDKADKLIQEESKQFSPYLLDLA